MRQIDVGQKIRLLMKNYVWLAVLMANCFAAQSATIGSSFYYQGRLLERGQPANGQYDLQFTLFAAETGGSPIGSPVTKLAVPVSNGVVNVTLDFGAGLFNGTAYWLELGVRTNGSASPFTQLLPRQPILAAPYAQYAPSAGSAGIAATAVNVSPNAVGATAIQDGSISAAKIAAGQVVKSLNGATDDVVLAGAGSVAIQRTGNTLTVSNAGWGLSGNAGTGGTSFLGTTDAQPLVLKANNSGALRLEPTADTPNVVAGFEGNGAAAVSGVAIGGGGLAGKPNYSHAGFATISGGLDNIIFPGSTNAVIGGGHYQTIYTNSDSATIAGGAENLVGSFAPYAAIGGGFQNSVGYAAEAGAIAGGYQNAILDYAYEGVIGGGANNTIGWNGMFGVIGGGYRNGLGDNAYYAKVGGGVDNTNNAETAVVGGGTNNLIQAGATAAVVAGGDGNTVESNAVWTVIGGGGLNLIRLLYGGTVAGGVYNYIENYADYGTISGGYDNWIQENAAFSTIPGGKQAATWNYGQLAYASGRDSQNYGDAQTSLYVLRRNTTNAVTAELFLDGQAERITILSNSSWAIQVNLVGRTGSGSTICYEYKGGVKKVGSAVNFVGTTATAINMTSVATDLAVTPPQVVVDSVNSALVIRVTGLSGNVIRWVARVQTTELIY